MLLVLIWVFQISSVLHNLSEMWSTYPTFRDALQCLKSPYSYVVMGTVILPAVVGIAHSFIELQLWSYLVSFSQLVMLTRFFLEGQVIPPCKLLVRTILVAVKQLSALSG